MLFEQNVEIFVLISKGAFKNLRKHDKLVVLVVVCKQQFFPHAILNL